MLPFKLHHDSLADLGQVFRLGPKPCNSHCHSHRFPQNVALQGRNQVVPFPAHLDWSQQDLNAGLEAAAAAVRQQGRRVAAVLFTNPTNPQGLVLSRPQVRSIISWCLKNKVHCIRCVWWTIVILLSIV